MVGFMVCPLFRLALTISHILLEKGNHPLGMPSDLIISTPFMSLPFFLRESVCELFLMFKSITYGQLLVTVNTFTEHHGGDWSAKDMQHTFVVSHYSDSPN